MTGGGGRQVERSQPQNPFLARFLLEVAPMRRLGA
jgi:hypothetical protein